MPRPLWKPTSQEYEEDVRARILFAVAAATVAVVLVAAMWVLRSVLLLIYVCALLAAGLRPLVLWIERRRTLVIHHHPPPRGLVILLLYAIVLAAVAGAAYLVLPPLVTQAQDLVARGPELLRRAQGFLDAHHLGAIRLDSVAPPRTSGLLGTVLGTVTGIVGGLLSVVTIVILTFYFLVEGDDLVAFWLRMLPRRYRARARTIGTRVIGKVSAWLVGQMILCVGIGVTAGVALVLLGVPFAYVLAIVAAAGELIPYAGPFLSGLLATTIATTTVSWHVGLATAAYFLVQQLLENNVIQPKIMSQQVGLSAATVIVAVLIGGALLGISGAVLAVPTAAIVQVTLRELATEP
jgi:predicted PurR-regulated permease PerM